MNVQQAIDMIHSPKGTSSVIAAVLLGGDMESIRDQKAVGVSLADAQAKLASSRKAQVDCRSDAAYWGYMGDISYWHAVVDILKAAELVGPDNLPDIQPPQWGGIVMGECDKVERFGRDILNAAKKAAGIDE